MGGVATVSRTVEETGEILTEGKREVKILYLSSRPVWEGPW